MQIVTIDVLYISLISPFFPSLTHTDTPLFPSHQYPLKQDNAANAILPHQCRSTPLSATPTHSLAAAVGEKNSLCFCFIIIIIIIL